MLRNNYDICTSASGESRSHITNMIRMLSLLYTLKVVVSEKNCLWVVLEHCLMLTEQEILQKNGF
jgi:hypothetical protein